MNNISPHQRQGGYLFEIPLLLVLVLIVVAILVPHLSVIGRKILISIAAVPVLFALFYMIVIPGWMPGNRFRLGPILRWMVFLLASILIVSVVVMMDLG